MKKVFVIALAFLFLFMATGYHFFFQTALTSYRENVAEKISENKTKTFSLFISTMEMKNKNIFHWTDKNEFEFNGNRYDVKSFQQNANGFTFVVFKDNEEQNMLTAYFNEVKNQSSSSSNNEKQNVKILKVDFLPEDFFSFSTKEISLNTKIFPITIFISAAYFQRISPPPKTV